MPQIQMFIIVYDLKICNNKYMIFITRHIPSLFTENYSPRYYYWLLNNFSYTLQFNKFQYIDLGTKITLLSIFETLVFPESDMTESNSFLRISKVFRTPSLPLYASPQIAGRPTNTILAPKASAFKTSVPFLTPPSK